ncbi:hypothetical protein GWN26_01230 [Candidatus Saccharibacteria bacterium]|nr:hypothetical protein [Candidatus Saccharibacteria bacterium]NIV03219.1 hypothetical protein [Calditrichia bacterium]NIS37725.1 hypothetical protein [Candidatus Saccharibacteria bacterium]NIV71778.1 hypothetical protein [Calditrichia bacterium]NIV97828.1 hypothetical protein [Candidatus Saccharibacteria bacterium]
MNQTKTKEEVLDREKMKMMAIYTAMITPGWNVACWITGLGIYCFTNIRKDETPACRFTRLVLGAPATLPAMAYEKLTGKEII